jgi:hypothetical protein
MIVSHHSAGIGFIAKPESSGVINPRAFQRVLNEGLKIALLRPNHTSSTALAGLVVET